MTEHVAMPLTFGADDTSRGDKRRGEKVRVIACGMIAREILAIRDQLGLDYIDLACLPAVYHHYPEKIAPSVDAAIAEARAEGEAPKPLVRLERTFRLRPGRYDLQLQQGVPAC